jgi:hypothetical protein
VASLQTGIILAVMAALAGPAWMLLHRRHGFPALPKHEMEPASSMPDLARPAEVLLAEYPK